MGDTFSRVSHAVPPILAKQVGNQMWGHFFYGDSLFLFAPPHKFSAVHTASYNIRFVPFGCAITRKSPKIETSWSQGGGPTPRTRPDHVVPRTKTGHKW